MSPITFETFKLAISRYFEPIAHEHGWPLICVNESNYEIQSPFFTMQIRFGFGMHNKNIDVVLRPANQNSETAKNMKDTFGVLAIAGYNDIAMDILPRQQTEDGFLDYAEYVASTTKKIGLPYLLGQKSDCEKIQEYWQKESEKEIEKIKGYKFSPQVLKRWHLPKP